MSESPHPFSSVNLLVLTGLAAAATVIAALGFEHIGGHVPCPLCLIERYPYYAGAPLALLAAWAMTRPGHRGIALALAGLVGLVFLTGFGLGVYHAGAEWGFWPGPSSCGAGALTSGSAAGLLQSLDNARVVRCDEASWRLLGLSFAGWNAVISLALAALALLALRKGTRGE